MEGGRISDKGLWKIQYHIFPTRMVFRRAPSIRPSIFSSVSPSVSVQIRGTPYRPYGLCYVGLRGSTRMGFPNSPCQIGFPQLGCSLVRARRGQTTFSSGRGGSIKLHLDPGTAETLHCILIRARRLQQGCSSLMPRRADQNAIHNCITT